MSVLILILQILGIAVLVVLVLAVIVLMLPAGLKISWQHGSELEIWLTAGPVRRRFFPPRDEEEAGEKPDAKTAPGRDAADTKTSSSSAGSGGKAKSGSSGDPGGATQPPSGTGDAADGANPPPAQPSAAPDSSSPKQEDELDRLYHKLMSDPVGYARKLKHWAGGPGKFLLDRLKVRHVRVVWTVTESNAAATAVTYGALIAACNTAWAVFRDCVDARADLLRILPDFTGERTAERCFACQITAKLYIIIASILLTFRAHLRRRMAAQARRTKAAAKGHAANKPA